MESDLSDDSKASLGSEEEEDEEEEKASPRRSRRRRSSIGLRVAFQFPTKKLAKKSDKNNASEPLFSSSHLQDNKKAILGRKKSCRRGKERDDSASESGDDSRDEGQESSDALLKRTMNIKENKAMVRPTAGGLGAVPGPDQWLLRLTELLALTATAALASVRKGALGIGWPFSFPEPQTVITWSAVV